MSLTKIAVTGPESSGKTSLAEDLSIHFDAVMAPEYARVYLEENGPEYSEDDFLEMFIIQEDQMQFYESLANEFVVFDTEVLVYKIWGEEKFACTYPNIEKAWKKQEMTHYLLCKPDLEWEADILRESPETRDALFLLYQAELNKLNRPYTIIEGKGTERFEKAKEAIGSLLIKQ